MALEEATSYLNNLEISSPALFKIIADEANEISAMLIERDSKGRLWYRCVQCGKLRDRENRARDCPNSDLKLKPYKCHGGCGNTSWFVQKSPLCRLLQRSWYLNPRSTKAYASEEVLDRHKESGSEKVDCPHWYVLYSARKLSLTLFSGAQVLKQNISRHMKSCIKG
jgi:hypothetical protein